MTDFMPPTGAPPPRVPEGWKAVWNDQYKEWFFVNLYTKKSQWDRPTEPAHRPDGDAPPDAPPPSYASGHNAPQVSDTKQSLESNNPYSNRNEKETDEQLARRLQDEERAGAGNRGLLSGGASNEYYNSGSNAGPGIQGGYSGAPASAGAESGRSKGLLGKLLGKASGGSHSQYQSSYPMGQAGGYGGYPQQGGYGGYPQPGYGGGPYGPQGGMGYGGGGYPPMGYQQPARRTGGMGGMGMPLMAGGAGLLGGMMIADEMNDNQQDAYQDGYQDGNNNDGGGGGDMGGGDMGGGDMGGGDF